MADPAGRRGGSSARRVAQAVPTVLLIVVVNFFVLHLAPGDVVDVLAGEAGAATAEYVAMLRQRFGLDQPLAAQLGSYVWGVVQLDLGYSFRHNTPVLELMLERLPATLLLMGTSIVARRSCSASCCGVTAARHVGPARRRRDLGLRAAVLRDADLLDRADADRAVLGQARLAADRRHDDDRRRPLRLRPRARRRRATWSCPRRRSRSSTSRSTRG